MHGESEHLHSLALMNELDQARNSDIYEDVRAHIESAIYHMEMIHEHLEESIPLLETSGQRRDAEKAKGQIEMALDLARTALDGPEAKMRAALQECWEHVETANRQMSRAGADAGI